MGLLNFGMGASNFLTTGGLGQRVQQTAHPPRFNCSFANPDSYSQGNIGSDGDLEWSFWVPDPDCVYNARAVEIYLPEGFELPPGSVDRLRSRLEVLRPKTCTIRVTETRGPERTILTATGA